MVASRRVGTLGAIIRTGCPTTTLGTTTRTGRCRTTTLPTMGRHDVSQTSISHFSPTVMKVRKTCGRTATGSEQLILAVVNPPSKTHSGSSSAMVASRRGHSWGYNSHWMSDNHSWDYNSDWTM